MAVQIEEVTTSKSGKSLRVKLGGNWYGANKDSGLDRAKGQLIEAEIETTDFGPWIKGWKPSAAPQNLPPPASPAVSAAAAPYHREPQFAGESGDNIQPFYFPFMSNVVAHAIEKGLITSPIGINEWALKAAQVAVATKEACK